MSNLNCKPNHLARVAMPNALAYGRIVTTLELFPAGTDDWQLRFGPLWRVDKELRVWNAFKPGNGSFYCPDSALKLIDGGESKEDSIVEIARLWNGKETSIEFFARVAKETKELAKH